MLSRHAAVEFASNLPPHVFCATIGYLEVVEQLCSEVVILSEGRVVAHDRSIGFASWSTSNRSNTSSSSLPFTTTCRKPRVRSSTQSVRNPCQLKA